MINFKDIWKFLVKGEIPGQLVIQMTDRCNASCPQCGMRVSAPFARTSLSTQKIYEILDNAAKKRFQAVSFTGGEPFLDMEKLTKFIHYAGDSGIPYIRTGTNGFIFRQPEKKGFRSKIAAIAKKLAETKIRNVWISIDSYVPSVHEEMRGFKGVASGIEKALPIFHEHGIFPSANLGINRNMAGPLTRLLNRNDYQSDGSYLNAFLNTYTCAFEAFYKFVIELGFTMVNTCYPMSIDESDRCKGLTAVYAATAIDDVVRYDGKEKAFLYRSLLNVIPRFRSKIRIFSPLSSLYALYHQYQKKEYTPYPCLGGKDFFFVSAKEGYFYPCGYRGEEAVESFSGISQLKETGQKKCTACDWECFRDPSELFGPLLQARSNFFGLVQKIKNDPVFFKLISCDLKYYQACQFFSGRKPLSANRLGKFDASTIDLNTAGATVETVHT